ncbi:MAG: AAA family ATPase [Candidatus Brocadiia bacterium]
MLENSFSHIGIRGFRRLAELQAELRPLNVLIGANGVGKTSFLDAFALLAASARGAMNKELGEMGGLVGVLTNDRASGLALDLSMNVPSHSPVDYHLLLALSGASYMIGEETLSQQRHEEGPPSKNIASHGTDIKYFNADAKKWVQPTWEHSYAETSLSQVPKMFREPEDFRLKLSSSTFYHCLNVEPRAPVRLPQQMRPADLPGRQGEDLVSCLYSLRETQRDRFETIEDTLKTAFPGFERLDFPPVAAGMLGMTWKDRAFSKPVYAHQLSEGTLRFLWLTTLLQSPGLTAVTLIDEPEVSLHPEMLSILAELMREASQRTQLIVATHSDRLVRFLKPEEVAVMDLNEDGSAKMTWADQMDLGEWLAEYTLDEVWRLGRMGGRA